MRLRTGLRLRLRLWPCLLLGLLARLGRPVFIWPIDARRSLVTGVGRVVRVWTRATGLAARLAAGLTAGPWRRIAPTPRVIPVVAVIAVVVTATATVTIILIVTEREHIACVGVPGSVTA